MKLATTTAIVLLAAPATAQAPSSCAEADTVVSEVAVALERYADAETAVLDGFRPISHDFPGMGEHWISLRHAVQDRFDPANPPVLLYARRDGVPVLVGAAFIALRDAGEPLPGPASLRHAWHEHNGTLDEELFAGDHRTLHDSDRFAVMVLHVWSAAPLDGGPFDVQNWRLPWIRAGLAAQDGVRAARGLSLLDSTEYYRRVLLKSGVPIEEAGLIDDYLARARAEVSRVVSSAPIDGSALALAWDALTDRLARRWPYARPAIERLDSDPRIVLECAP